MYIVHKGGVVGKVSFENFFPTWQERTVFYCFVFLTSEIVTEVCQGGDGM